MWDGVQRAINAMNNGKGLPNPEDVQNAINNSDTKLAQKLIDDYKLTTDIEPRRIININKKPIARNLGAGLAAVRVHNEERINVPVDGEAAEAIDVRIFEGNGANEAIGGLF